MRWAWLFVVAGCSQFDITQPIAVVADPAWDELDRATLAAAAQCWNLQFGLQLVPTTRPDTAQMVYFDYAPLACWSSWGRYLPGEPAHDSVCPLTDVENIEQHERVGNYEPAVLLFTIVEHELGHALNIPNVSSESPFVSTYAVMVHNMMPSLAYEYTADGDQEQRPAFSAFDGDQLAAANPGFAPRPTCDTVVLVSDPVTAIACACP